MALRSSQMVPSTASRVLIRIDNNKQGEMMGVLYNPYLEKGSKFVDVVEFTNRLDDMFDTLQFPQAAVAYRSFDSKRSAKAGAQEKPKGKVDVPVPKNDKLNAQDKDVFVVHVQFRQNATWQGTVQWAEQKEEKRFRSTLELLKIMDSALASKYPQDDDQE